MVNKFECQSLFNQALEDGINLFLGAGFSVASTDKQGNNLPIGNALLKELKCIFYDINSYTDLSKACTKLKRAHKEKFYSFLEKRFDVAKYDPLYDVISRININNIYTTNIDNLIYKIMDNNGKYLHDRGIKGAPFKNEELINYFPLHGCIKGGGEYIFGATEIATAFSKRSQDESWRQLAIDAASKPILFWGWNFQDTGPIEAMYKDEKIERNINKWALLYEPTYETVDYLKTLGFAIIEADTMTLLRYLEQFLNSRKQKTRKSNCDVIKTSIECYLPPSNDKSLETYPLKMMFLDYLPRWSHIYSEKIPITTKYREIANEISGGKNIIVYGIRGSGKTTLLRQLLVYYDTKKAKTYLEAPSLEIARKYIKDVNGQDVILFVDDCFRDTEAILELCKNNNIQVVAFDRDFSYESQFSRLPRDKFSEPIDTTYIEEQDAQSILNIIPNDLKKAKCSTNNFNKDPNIPNLLAANIRAVNFSYFKRFFDTDPNEAELFLLICYIHSCGVPCSFDMIYSYLGDREYSWQDMMSVVHRIGGLIKENSDTLGSYSIAFDDQDYYECRSRFFAEKILNSVPKGELILAKVLLRFAECVPIYKICLYDKFKRSGYDADWATKAFVKKNDGLEYYNLCRKKDENEYVYQQAAIYFSKLGDYKEAFAWIDNARNLSHYNKFSIDSTYARLFFEANVDVDKILARDALEILNDCCTKDERKCIHFLMFAKCVLRFCKKYGKSEMEDFLTKALKYIEDGLNENNWSLSKNNKYALRDVKIELEDIM